jgi:hypothetical protein
MARAIQAATREHGGEVLIKVVSADGAETFTSEDPGFLESPDMPRTVAMITLSCGRYDSPFTCRLDFRVRKDPEATLSVDGTDINRVAGLFDELCRYIEQRYAFGRWLAEHIDDFWIVFVLGTLMASAVYNLFDIPLDFAMARVPSFRDSTLRAVISTIGWAAVAIGALSGGFWLKRLLGDSFPVIELAGKLSDGRSVRRATIVWVFSAILFPLVLRSFLGFVGDMIRQGRP